MGFAHPETGVYVFNDMDAAEPVRELVRTLLAIVERGEVDLPASLRKRMEGTLPFDSVKDLPWQERG